jgi:hypothetical protein
VIVSGTGSALESQMNRNRVNAVASEEPVKSESIFAEITYQLTGYTSLRRLEFGQVGEPGVYELVLVLARGSDSQSPAISARFRNVSNLAVQDFGGGLTQLLYLAVEDMSSRQ